MPNTTMKTQIQVRRDTTANWLANKDVVPALVSLALTWSLALSRLVMALPLMRT